MNWTAKDMDTYLQQKEYIDTFIVPLLKLETDPENMKNSSSSSEFLMHLTTFIETQFKGRMMLMPPFSYTQSTDFEEWRRHSHVTYRPRPLSMCFSLRLIRLGRACKWRGKSFGCHRFHSKVWTRI